MLTAKRTTQCRHVEARREEEQSASACRYRCGSGAESAGPISARPSPSRVHAHTAGVHVATYACTSTSSSSPITAMATVACTSRHGGGPAVRFRLANPLHICICIMHRAALERTRTGGARTHRISMERYGWVQAIATVLRRQQTPQKELPPASTLVQHCTAHLQPSIHFTIISAVWTLSDRWDVRGSEPILVNV